MSATRVPLTVDAQLGVDIIGYRLPLRVAITLLAVVPPAFLVLHLGLPFVVPLAVVSMAVVGATALAVPEREGVWVVVSWLYRAAARCMPTQLESGRWSRGAVEISEIGTLATAGARPAAAQLTRLGLVPECRSAEDGLLEVVPGGWRAVLRLDGPTRAPGSLGYRRWCEVATAWLRGLDCPVQLVTEVGHLDRRTAERTWDRVSKVDPPDGPLARGERRFAADMAASSLSLTHYVLLAPQSASSKGVPHAAGVLGRVARATARDSARRALETALDAAATAGIGACAAPVEDIRGRLLAETVLGAPNGAVVPAGVWLGGVHVGILTATALPPVIDFGAVVRAVQRAQVRATVSLHMIPVARGEMRTALRHQRSALRHSVEAGRQEEDDRVAYDDVRALQAAVAAGEVVGVRIALTAAVKARSRQECRDGTERLRALLIDVGFRVERPTLPGLLPAMAATPGLPPLRRSLQLTTDVVAARLLPALGTPFADPAAPILGRNRRTGATAHLDLFSCSNHNALVVGSSGSGKSVAAKVLSLRHVLQGCTVIALDPDSEFLPVITLAGGRYYELAESSVNPLGFGTVLRPDEAAETIVSVLSVMAGDCVGYVGGRPIRRLPGEDKGWLKREVTRFLVAWRGRRPGEEPVLSALVEHLAGSLAADGGLTQAELERGRRVCLRLAEYTGGIRGRIFDRPSSFRLDPGVSVGVGLQSMSLTYAADLTPALAVVLTHVLGALAARRERILVVVDEAHVLTADPDAGEVVNQLLRRARKCGAGVLFASQRVEEFVATDLGRTCATVSSTKLILGQEDPVAALAAEVFKLDEEEAAEITPGVRGRGVLISGDERTVVDVIPGPVLMPFVRTDAAAASGWAAQ